MGKYKVIESEKYSRKLKLVEISEGVYFSLSPLVIYLDKYGFSCYPDKTNPLDNYMLLDFLIFNKATVEDFIIYFLLKGENYEYEEE